MLVLGEFFKLVCIEGIAYVSVDRPVEICQYLGNSYNWYVKRKILTYLWIGQWNYACTGGILQTGRYRGHN